MLKPPLYPSFLYICSFFISESVRFFWISGNYYFSIYISAHIRWKLGLCQWESVKLPFTTRGRLDMLWHTAIEILNCLFLINAFSNEAFLRIKSNSELLCVRFVLRRRNTFSTHIYWEIFTMVTYFLRWTLLKFFSSFPDEQSQQKLRQLDRITVQWLIHQMKSRDRYCGNFEFIIFLWEF